MAKKYICRILLSSIILLVCSAQANDGYEVNADSVRHHVEVLASDSLEGRQVGEAGEMRAANYIMNVFEHAGLTPAGDDGTYLQPFEFTKAIEPGTNNRLSINGVALELGSGFNPMHQSGDGEFNFAEVVPVGFGITVDHPPYDDYEDLDIVGKAVMIKRYAPDDTTLGIEWDKYSSFTDKILNAIKHEAAGVFFVTPTQYDDTILSIGVTRVARKDIPIIHLRRAALEKLGIDLENPTQMAAEGAVDLVRIQDTGYNVVGRLDGESERTIIVGAHYDHLGWGTPASLYTGPEPAIHYGADDNGSGSAALLELVRHYSNHATPLHHSMVFIAFSGEEAGLLGSSYYARNSSLDTGKVHMMVNMDMIGRLKDQENGLAIFGTGTCEEFKSYFDSLDGGDIKLSVKESGAGPSDHTAFYNQGIPVLHFFTGAHGDYHKPLDTPDKLDYPGIVKITDLVEDIIDHFNTHEKPLTFQRTKDSEMGKRRSAFSVTLGVMPDYIAEVKGLKIDGVTPEKTAEKAGILKGDVVIKIGEYTIDDIYAYMNALGKFRKGDSTVIVVDRSGDTLSLPAVFE